MSHASSSFIVTLSLIRRRACAPAQFSGCSSTTNDHSETGQMAVCCQNLTLGALSRCSALSMLVGALFKKVQSLFEQASYILMLNYSATKKKKKIISWAKNGYCCYSAYIPTFQHFCHTDETLWVYFKRLWYVIWYIFFDCNWDDNRWQ